MTDPDEIPSAYAEFDALTRAQLADVAESGRRIERAHRISPRPRSRARLRLVKTGARPVRRSRVPVAVQYLIAILVIAAIVAISLAFPTKRAAAHAAPLVRADVVVPTGRLFPDHFTGTDKIVYQLLTTSTSTNCAPRPGVPSALASAVAQAGGCEAIELALYADAGKRILITVGVITMRTVDEMQMVNDAILRSGGAMMVGMLRPSASAHVPELVGPHNAAQRPAYVTPTGSAVIVGVGDATVTGEGDPAVLQQGITQVMGTVALALAAGQPTVRLSQQTK